MRHFQRLLVCCLLVVLAAPAVVRAEPEIDKPEVTGEGDISGLITRITPARESVVQTRHPVIAAYFGNWGRGVAFATIQMWVNGQEVQPQIRTAALVSYRPLQPLPVGRTGVQIRVFDQGGLRADVVWAFTIQGGFIPGVPGGGYDGSGPVVTSVRPARESVVNTAQPLIAATFGDRGAGVDPNRTRLWVDGREVAPQVRTASLVQYQPPTPLPIKRIGVEVWVFDRYGNRTDVVWAFSIAGYGLPGPGVPPGGIGGDQRGPVVTSITPGREETVGNNFPVIGVSFADRGTGVAADRTRLWVNGQEVTPQIRSASRVQYRPERPLPAGRVGVQAWIFDNAGNRTDIIWAFTVSGAGVPGPGVPPGGDQRGPIVTQVTPGREETVRGNFPVIGVSFADRGTGVDASRTRLWVNGQEVTPQFRTASRVQYRPDRPLPVGRIGVQAWIFDNAGNRTDVLWAFTIVR
jgi:hypothetical protein